MKKETRPVDKVANNPRIDRTYRLDRQKAYEDEIKNTLYDMKSNSLENYGYRRTASGRMVPRDEPDMETQYKQAELIRKQISAKKAAIGRERLKASGKIPTKGGAKLFERFMDDAAKATGKTRTAASRESLVEKDLKNIYNAANNLDFLRWVMFLDMETGGRYKLLKSLTYKSILPGE